MSLEERVRNDLFREVVLDRVLQELVLVPGALPAEQLQEATHDPNLFEEFLGSEVVLCSVVLDVNQGEELSKGVVPVKEVGEDVLVQLAR